MLGLVTSALDSRTEGTPVGLQGGPDRPLTVLGPLAPAPSLAVRARPVVADLVALTKPRIMELVVVTGAATAVGAAGGWPGARPLTAVILGGGMAAGGAGSINCALEGELDRRMPRTRHRAVAAGRIPAGVALAQGILLNIAAMILIVAATNRLTAAQPARGGNDPASPPTTMLWAVRGLSQSV